MLKSFPPSIAQVVVVAIALLACQPAPPITAQDKRTSARDTHVADAFDELRFKQQVQPLVEKFCVRCHNADEMKSGVRVDGLSAVPEDKQLFLLNGIRQQIDDGAMPPEDEPQPSTQQRRELVNWINDTVAAARSRERQLNGSVRRLTVSQYKNTLQDLLGLEEDLTEALPPDAISKDGFANNTQSMVLSPLLIESYFDIAEAALELCLVNENTQPIIQNFRVDLGAAVNPTPCPDKLILGANSELLNNADLLVTELQPAKPFEYTPFAMRTRYEFIEGYVGNDTIRAWRTFDSIYHSVFACVRGSPGYPKGEAYQAVKSGLLLRPAIPSPELFGVSNTYGPMANFKISLRELPEGGNFRVRIKAARYDDGLLFDAGTKPLPIGDASISVGNPTQATLNLSEDGIYQLDVYCSQGKPAGLFGLSIDDREFAGQLLESSTQSPDAERPTPFLLVRLTSGEHKLTCKYGDNARLKRIVLHRVDENSEWGKRFSRFEQRSPSLAVSIGLRRDCGSTLTQVGAAQAVSTNELKEYVFGGAIQDYPNPEVEKDNVNYLAGVREIGVRSEYTDGRDMPRLLVRSVEFEGPYYETWPPETHRRILIASTNRDDPAAYARNVLQNFATRAFRRPVTDRELQPIIDVWKASYDTRHDFQQSVKDALLVVLTSPQFLFLIENSSSPEPEDLESFELASKLSYFLWNGPPDQTLLDLAARNQLNQAIDSQIDRLVQNPRFSLFTNQFVSQWLSLDKFDVVATDIKRYPTLTRDTKTQLRQEPIQFVQYLIQHNRPVSDLIQSDFIVANETVASYYDLGDRSESGFQFLPIKHENKGLGGVLTQASILAGLSDGRESNPIKRGAWVARKIVAEPPDDPPPNVPQLKDEEGSQLTLREKLERHRNQKGCAKCHSGIDPWGVPFELMDASGLRKKAVAIDASSTLPDGHQVRDLDDLRDYLAHDRIDQVAFSFMKHLAGYAVGRSLSFNEIAFLREHGVKLKSSEYRMQEMLRFVVKSDLFLKK